MNVKIIYKGSYRDEELNILYRLVCVIVPVDEEVQQRLEPEQRTYDTVQIILHNISKKNRDPKILTFSVGEIMPEAGGEWMANNYFELKDELYSRLQLLTGYIDKDFTDKDSIIKTGDSEKVVQTLQFFTTSPEAKAKIIEIPRETEQVNRL